MRFICLKFLVPALLSTSFYASAQKLPNVQPTSLRAPVNIKVDGKTTEWDDKLQAYNKATDVFYTIANDDNKLYLTIQATDESVIRKITLGRIIFSINPSAKKIDDNNLSISYPIISRKDRPGINLKDTPKIIEGNKKSLLQADSFMNINNKRFAEKSKLIKVTGVSGLDTLISVYNADGIKAIGAFNNKMNYTYELSVDLKLLGPSIKDGAKFYYNVKTIGLPLDDMPGVEIIRDAGGTITAVNIHKDQMPANSVDMRAVTDFWGEYILAK